VGQIFRIGTVRYAENLWAQMRSPQARAAIRLLSRRRHVQVSQMHV